jgi:transcriptional regulator with XRE-family HTH domain
MFLVRIILFSKAEVSSMGVNRFKLARLEKGLRQIDVARAAHIGEGYLSRIETGRVNPRPEVVKRIAQVLNISSDFLASVPVRSDAVLHDGGINRKHPEDEWDGHR